VPDPVESVRQDMDQEPPDELVRLKRQDFVAVGSLDPVVLVAERYAGCVGRLAPAPARRIVPLS
jgi:hypothetical protein